MIPKIYLYAKSIKPLLEWLKDNPDDKDIKYTITRLIRYYSSTPKELGLPYMYSEAALNEVKKSNMNNPSEKLKWITWKQQTNKKGFNEDSRLNGIFHLEHIIPVSQIAKELYDLSEITEDSIYHILVNNFKIAWILKKEQRLLDSVNRSGIRTPQLLNDLNIYIKGFNN